MQVPAPARAKLLLGFHWLYGCRDEHFGNGRLVRNTFENSVRRLANRVASIAPVTRELLTVLTTDDIYLDKVPSDIWQQLDRRRNSVCRHLRELRENGPRPRQSAWLARSLPALQIATDGRMG